MNLAEKSAQGVTERRLELLSNLWLGGESVCLIGEPRRCAPGQSCFQDQSSARAGTCQILPDFALTKPISCVNDIHKLGLTAGPLLVWPPDHNNWPRSA